MAEIAQVGPHVTKMIGYIQRLTCLGFVRENDLTNDRVL